MLCRRGLMIDLGERTLDFAPHESNVVWDEALD